MKMPGIITQSSLVRSNCQCKVMGGWVHARPLPFYSIGNRLKATWLVFTGRADAFVWDLLNESEATGTNKKESK